MQFRILDIFCGAGGLSYGLEKNKNFETIIGVDYDQYAINTFSANFPKSLGLFADITGEQVKQDLINLSKKQKINAIIGGPPCQGFSLKGKNLGMKDSRNFLFLDYLELVQKISPELVIIENVKNILSSSKGYFIDQIVEKLKAMKYHVNFGILNSSHFGVPQNRERAFIICSKSHHINLPKKTAKKPVSVRDAISDLAYLNSAEGELVATYTTEAQSKYQKKMRQGANILTHHKATNHSELCLKKLKMIPPEGDKSHLPMEYHGKQKFSTTWSRLIWDKPSPTIDTRFDTPSNGRNSHPYLHRSITPREAARLQSFDDKFEFHGTKGAICKQIGNAVPPLLARAIGKSINESYL